MPISLEEKPSSFDLQIKALRDALERAARAAQNAESTAQQARADLQNERQRHLHAAAQLQCISGELKAATEENKRLKQAVGEYYRERETLTERIKELTMAAPGRGLRVIDEEPTPEPDTPTEDPVPLAAAGPPTSDETKAEPSVEMATADLAMLPPRATTNPLAAAEGEKPVNGLRLKP